jgi:digeranylgeranylglycerophospholipid reductase
MDKYDIIVVGAGPAGLGFVSHIDDRRILVIDKKEKLGVPIKSSAGTFTETINEFDLKEAVCHSSRGFRIVLDDGSIKEFLYEKPVLHTIDFEKMIEILAERARMNCEILHPASVDKVVMNDGKVESIEVGDQCFTADLFVDASGEARVLLQQLDRSYYQKQWLVQGLEFEASGLDLNPEYFDFFFGNRLMPEGYCWVFPTGTTSARIGLGKLIPGRGGRRKIRLENAFRNFTSSNVITVRDFRERNVRDSHRGIMTYYKPLGKAYFKNCFVIGDASSQSSCLLGEGIRFSLKSGRELAIALSCFDLEYAKMYYQRSINGLTNYFSLFPLFLRYFKWAPNWGIHGLVNSLSNYDNANMLRVMRSEFRGSDFFRLVYTLPKNLLESRTRQLKRRHGKTKSR